MMVYVVWRGCYTDRSIGKIFSKLEDAENYVTELESGRKAIGEDIYIESYNVE
jgi:hypothetical protein